MILTDPNYRILRAGTISGICYFLAFLLLAWSEWILLLFYFTMFYLPGVTFALITANYSKLTIRFSDLRFILHFVFSILIYFYNLITFFDDEVGFLFGAVGSGGYLIMTMVVLNIRMDIPILLLTIVASGLSTSLIGWTALPDVFTGFCVMLWTIINAAFMNYTHIRNGTVK